MTHDAIRFSCTACGNCCRDYWVPVTDADLRLLPVPLPGVVQWLDGQQVDMTGEPETFVVLPQGRRLLVLKRDQDGCCFLRENRCTIYSQRPRSCRNYPFDVTLDGAGNVRRLQLVGQERCLGARDGLHSAATLAQGKRAERGELQAYVEAVSRFNRRQKHRQRLGKRLLDETAFYEFLGLTPSPSSGAASPTTLGSDSA